MKYFKFLLPLILFACGSPDQEQSREMSFAAALAPAPILDSQKITPNGDTIRYYHTVETGTYSYNLPSVEVRLKGTVTPPVNQAPVARITAVPTSITLPVNTVNLSGITSTDADGAIASWLWIQVAGPPVGSITDANKVTTDVTGLTTAGTYTYRLTVTDNKGAQGTAVVNIIVNPAITPPSGQPIAFSFTPIPVSNTDLVAPGRGAEQWHDRNDVNVPNAGTRTIPLDRYQRFVATRIANSATRGSYNWTFFDNLVSQAVANNQKLSFGIMTVYGDGNTSHGLVQFSDGGFAAYPEWLHKIMMTNSNTSLRPWRYDSYWIPNYNSQDYSNWLLEFHKAIDSHIKTTTISGVPTKNVINVIDIRGVGNWGEWHHHPYVGEYPNKLPSGHMPTFESLKRIVDSHLQGFPDNPLVAMISAHDREFFVNTWNPPAISDYLVAAKNNWGGVGYRNDHWGSLDTYTWQYLDHPAVQNVWKTGYVTGEPPGGLGNTNNMGDLTRQLTKYHAAMIGNGNMGDIGGNTTVQNNIRAASKASGYRIISTGGTFTPGATSISITTNWQNTGIAPTYENWNINYELVSSSGAVTQLGTSGFKLRLFLPGTAAHTETFPMNVSAGSYTLRMVVKDPNGYRAPLPLAIPGRNADGSYNIKTFNR